MQHIGNLFLVGSDHTGDVELASSNLFGNLLWLEASLNHGIGDEEQRTFVEHALVLEGLDHYIGQWHFVLVDAVNSHQSAQGALYSHCGVLLHKGLYIFSDTLGQASGIFDLFKI